MTLRTEVAARLRRAVSFDAHAFGTADPSTGLLNHLVAEQMPPALALAYANELYPLQSAEYTIDAARDGQLLFRAGAESPDIARVQRENGFRFGIDVLVSSHGYLWGKWCLLREERGAGDGARETALLKRLLPHLSRGLQRAALVDASFESDRLRGATVAGVLVLDRRLRVVVRSPSVSPMLEDLADVGVAFDGGIPLSILTLARQLREAARCTTDGIPSELMLRARGRSGQWYVIQGSLAETTADGVSRAVVVVRPMVPREMAPMLTTLYGLSVREREIVAAVVRGDTTKVIAEKLRISPHTVKHHLDRACEKTGARGRRALIARLFRDAYRPTLIA